MVVVAVGNRLVLAVVAVGNRLVLVVAAGNRLVLAVGAVGNPLAQAVVVGSHLVVEVVDNWSQVEELHTLLVLLKFKVASWVIQWINYKCNNNCAGNRESM